MPNSTPHPKQQKAVFSSATVMLNSPRVLRVTLTEPCCSCPPPSAPSSRPDSKANPHRCKHRSLSSHRGAPAGAGCLARWIRPARRPEAPRSLLLLLQLLGGAATWKPTTQGPTAARTEHTTITELHGCLALLESVVGMVEKALWVCGTHSVKPGLRVKKGMQKIATSRHVAPDQAWDPCNPGAGV